MSNNPPIEVPQGAIRLNTDSQRLEFFAQDRWHEFAVDSPILDGGTRGIFAGGFSPGNSDRIDFISINQLGNATDFGNLTVARGAAGAAASRTRGLMFGGTGPNTNTIDYWTISSTGDAQDFGDIANAGHWTQAVSNQVRAVTAGGNSIGNVINYVQIATTGNAKDFGDLTYKSDVAVSANSSIQSPTRGIFAGGTPSTTNGIDFIIISTEGNSQEFGDYTTHTAREARGSNATRGLFIGGTRAEPSSSNIIDFITLATLGNATDFGDIRGGSISNSAGCASPVRVAFAYGNSPGNVDTINYVTIMTKGDAIDFGDLSQARNHLSGSSNGHGGL